MAYYDEACIERLKVIQHIQEARYFPLFLIKNILRRMDEGLSLSEAESVEDAVFGTATRSGQELVDRATLLAETGLTEEELRQAETVGVLIPFVQEAGKTLYDGDDIQTGRDSLRRLIDYGLTIRDMAFFVELGEQIVEREMALRRKIVSNKTTKENTRVTAEISETGDFYREYIMRRLFQRQVRENIRKSLDKKKRNTTETL